MIPNEYAIPERSQYRLRFYNFEKSKLKSDIKVSYTIDKIALIVYNMDNAKNYC